MRCTNLIIAALCCLMAVLAKAQSNESLEIQKKAQYRSLQQRRRMRMRPSGMMMRRGNRRMRRRRRRRRRRMMQRRMMGMMRRNSQTRPMGPSRRPVNLASPTTMPPVMVGTSTPTPPVMVWTSAPSSSPGPFDDCDACIASEREWCRQLDGVPVCGPYESLTCDTTEDGFTPQAIVDSAGCLFAALPQGPDEDCSSCIETGREWCSQITGIGWCGPIGTLSCDKILSSDGTTSTTPPVRDFFNCPGVTQPPTATPFIINEFPI